MVLHNYHKGGPYQHYVRAVSTFDVEMIDAILAWKESPNETITGRAVDELWNAMPYRIGYDFVTAAPWKMERTGPYHPGTELARGLAERLAVPFKRCFAQRKRHRRKGSFRSGLLPELIWVPVGQTILFVDDVVCSGETVETCLRVLGEKNIVLGLVWLFWDRAAKRPFHDSNDMAVTDEQIHDVIRRETESLHQKLERRIKEIRINGLP